MTVVAGRYRLLTRLGQGGMGVVWRAHDELLRRDVAVKELHVRIGVDDDFRARQVLREARAAARLRHPGVVAIHDVVVDDGRPVIVMELVEGPSLADLVRTEGPLSEQCVAEFGVRVLAALAAAHEHGVVHRDVKPGNVLFDGDRVVLTDFGIAATGDTTLTDSVLGSPEYLAPERVNGEPATPASDLWSLGVTLCAALRGASPFQRSDTQSTLAAVLSYDLPPVVQAPRLWPVLAALLHKDPRQRPAAASAAEMLAVVAEVPMVPAEPVTVRVDEPVTDLVAPAAGRPGPDRRVQRVVALLAVLVVVLVVGGVWLVMRGEATDGTPTAPAVAAPSGFTGHRGDGFTIAVPSSWFHTSSNHELFWENDPNDESALLAHLEWWDDDVHPDGARGLLTDIEDDEFTAESVTGYRRISLVTIPAPEGMTSAELEVTYHDSEHGELTSHEVIRAVITDTGQTYLLSVVATSDNPAEAEQLWQAGRGDLTKILDSFHVRP